MIPEKNITKLGTMVTGEIVNVHYKQGAIVNKGDIIITINPGVGYEPYHIKANIDGRIQELTYKNPGSVVKQGDALAILVPLDQKLIVVGQLQIKDRGYIEVGSKSKDQTGQFSEAFTYLPIDSQSNFRISPDAVQTDSMSYYEIELELDTQTFRERRHAVQTGAGCAGARVRTNRRENNIELHNNTFPQWREPSTTREIGWQKRN